MFWTHSLVTRHDEHKVMRSTTVRNKVKLSGIYALSATAKTKPYKERFSPRISRLVKTACNIFYISLAVLKLITCVPKISDFFPSRLGYWQVFGACQYFPSPSSNRHLLHLFLSDLQQTSPCKYWVLFRHTFP